MHSNAFKSCTLLTLVQLLFVLLISYNLSCIIYMQDPELPHILATRLKRKEKTKKDGSNVNLWTVGAI